MSDLQRHDALHFWVSAAGMLSGLGIVFTIIYLKMLKNPDYVSPKVYQWLLLGFLGASAGGAIACCISTLLTRGFDLARKSR